MMRNESYFLSVISVLSLATLLTGCTLAPDPYTKLEFAAKAQLRKDSQALATDPITGPISLAEAMARTFKHNLDHRVKIMEDALAMRQLDLSRFDLLPKLTAQAGYAGRDKFSASSSMNLDGVQVENFSYSQERDRITSDLTLSWNVLDFGVSYINAQQAGDRNLIAQERRRKVIYNLMQEVRSAFLRVVTAQLLNDKVDDTIHQGEKAMEDLKHAEKENISNPIEILRAERSMLEIIRQLESIKQELSVAQTELSVLMGLSPGTEFTVMLTHPEDLEPPVWEIPVERMEELALRNNPDLRETVYNERISVLDTRKSILKILPGISFNVSRQYDRNVFLHDNQWSEAGARISWNLFNILSAPSEIDMSEAGLTLAQKRAEAMQMAVLAQTHIARHQFETAFRNFQRATQIRVLDERIFSHSRLMESQEAQSPQERIANESTMIVSTLRQFQALAQLQGSLGRMRATLGLDLLPATLDDHGLTSLTQVFDKALSESTREPAILVKEESPVPMTEAPPPVVETVAEPAVVVEETPRPVEPEPSPAAMDEPSWLQQQSPNKWVIQLNRLWSEEETQRFLTRHGVTDVVIVKHKGKRYHTVILKDLYDNVRQARQAIRHLPFSKRGLHPAPKSVAKLQAGLAP